MKFALIIDDESWFWVLDETGREWQCWYENGDLPATRASHLDRWSLDYVTQVMNDMATTAQNDLVRH